MAKLPSLKCVTEFLADLVACPSVDAGERTSFERPYGEAALVELLERKIAPWGAEITVTEVFPNRPNLLAHFRGTDRTKSLLLEAHADTVDVTDMAFDPFDPVVADGRLRGRGACDTKGGMAAMLLALRYLLDRDGQPPIDVYFAATCNEETGAGGAKRLMTDGLRPDAAIVAEPTELEIVYATRGAVRLLIKTRGVPAHSSTPGRGVNAIDHMRRILAAIEEQMAPSLAQRPHPVMGAPTICVGTIHGGTQVNVVPAACAIEVDRRLVPGEDAAEVEREIAEMVAAAGQGLDQFDATCRTMRGYPPFEEDADGPLAQRVAAACQKVLSRATFATAPWSCDAGVFKQAGIPSIVLGPGSIRQAHTRDESIELAQVVTAVELYAEILSAGL